jgi:hypothetical protein
MEHYGVVQERQKYVFADEDLAHALAHSSGRFAGTSECGGDDHSTGTGTGVPPSAPHPAAAPQSPSAPQG